MIIIMCLHRMQLPPISRQFNVCAFYIVYDVCINKKINRQALFSAPALYACFERFFAPSEKVHFDLLPNGAQRVAGHRVQNHLAECTARSYPPRKTSLHKARIGQQTRPFRHLRTRTTCNSQSEKCVSPTSVLSRSKKYFDLLPMAPRDRRSPRPEPSG